ncbi:hypothetical protein RAA17_15960 [Komagataeibacter rhaeticus]|nr:hypothetical protein [Komagataeibacter rhaeticus]
MFKIVPDNPVAAKNMIEKKASWESNAILSNPLIEIIEEQKLHYDSEITRTVRA